jgi:hypothetical protein
VQIQRNLQLRIEASRTVMEPPEEHPAQGVGISAAAFAGVGEQEEEDGFDDVQLLSVAGSGYSDARFPSKIS